MSTSSFSFGENIHNTRIPLHAGNSLTLKNNDNNEYQEYVIDSLVSDNGSSCLCYRARMKGMKHRSFVLKEFYPCNKGVLRDENGEIILPKEVFDDRARFINAAVMINEISLENEFRHNIVGDVVLLFGNGTVYCRNEDYTRSKTWDQIEDRDFLQVLTCLKAIARFLNRLHKDQDHYAYMDLKAENILLRNSGYGIIYDEPVFFDFDSVLTEGEHKLDDVFVTKRSKNYLSGDNISLFTFENPDQQSIQITSEQDKMDFVKLFQEKIAPFESVLNVATHEACDQLCTELLNNSLGFSELESRLNNIIVLYNEPRLNMCRNSYEINKRKYSFLYKTVLPITIFICVGLSVVYAYLVSKSGLVFPEDTHGRIGMMIISFFILLCFTLIIQGLKLLLIFLGIQKNNAAIASQELLYGTCGSDITQYILGDRNKSQFLEGENAKLHQKRQKRRILLWVFMVVLLSASLGISICICAFPLFLMLGSGILIIFMLTDSILSNREFYKKACESQEDNVSADSSIRDSRARFFEDEYIETNGTFDLHSDYYKEYEINLFSIRNELKEQGGRFKTSFDHEAKRRIYSMAIDRIRNIQLVFGIVTILLNLFVLLLDLMIFFDLSNDYYMIPADAYRPITYIAIILNLAVNVIQIISVNQQEKSIAQMAFNSRFLEDKELERRLGDDIAEGHIKPIDIVRGIYQYDAFCYSQKNRPALSYKNKLQLHYVEIADKRRLKIVIGLLFCALFSGLVWMRHMYLLLPALIMGTIICLMTGEMLLPYLSRTSMCWRIKKQRSYQYNEED